MSPVYESVEQLIGHTPLLHLRHFEDAYLLYGRLYAKLEYLNPAGSAKDRAVRAMLDDAEARGLLQPGATIIEPTSGNTGIALAALAAVRRYHAVIVMPDSMSVERRLLMEAYGAQVELTPGAQGMAGAIARAEEIAAQLPGSLILGQFSNHANARAHEETTGPEILADLEGAVDIIVGGIGTGGTMTGIGRYMRRVKPDVRLIGVEPAASPVLTQGTAGKHGLQGIGAGFIPEVLDASLMDEIIPVRETDAYAVGRALGEFEGVLAGISSGAALWAAVQVAQRPENEGKNIVVILPDGGDKYLSTIMYTRKINGDSDGSTDRTSV